MFIQNLIQLTKIHKIHTNLHYTMGNLKGANPHDLGRLDFSSKGLCTCRTKDFIMGVQKYLPNCWKMALNGNLPLLSSSLIFHWGFLVDVQLPARLASIQMHYTKRGHPNQHHNTLRLTFSTAPGHFTGDRVELAAETQVLRIASNPPVMPKYSI